MKLPRKRVLSWSLLAGVLVSLSYFIVLWGDPNDLEGKFSSYQFFPHSRADVLEFENGLVTLKTCCGNEFYGEYQHADDSWIWYHQEIWRRDPPQFRFKKPLRVKVEPHLFSITLRFDNGDSLKLPRRVFTSVPL